MAKEKKAETREQSQDYPTNEQGVVVAASFDEIEVASPGEQINVADILAALGSPEADGAMENPAEWQASIVGSDYFWPAARGLAIRGFIVGVEERQTSLIVDGKALRTRFYTFELTAPCIAIRSEDVVRGQPLPAPVQCQPGMHVAVLERKILERLQNDIGKEVIVVCDGPAKTKRGLNLWKYRSWRRVKVQVVEERQLGGSQEPRALPSAS